MCCDLQMLSVQVPGCAGMERLGAPGGPRLRHDHRHHHSTLEWEKQQRLQAMVGRLQEMVEQETRARSAAAAERLGLPPSIQLPDGEYGQDAHLQLRVPYQVPSRADEKQFSTSTEQVRERRARVGGNGGRAAGASGSGRRGRRQERRPSAKGDSMVGAHGRAAAAHVPAGQRAAALRDGATPGCALAAARRVTSPHLRTSLSYHAYIPLSGRSDSSECTRVPEYYRLDNLFIWDSRPPDRAAERVRVLCDMCDRVV
ncbi:uncharacterized protein LOC125069588 isoform X1 [Vanessa atalanta]|uniref:uncharacterized protein LOC125069588 isoform X1 n=3 Tax=Vanessa atalanta TaxID=42275 RepID=UPI001FCD255C|nr:uncharacterized protein LOC125069588 isoform X1 [Vanessa atalanta]